MLMFLINVKLNRHYNCIDFGLLSCIILGDKGIWIISLVKYKLWLGKEIKLPINNVMFLSWNAFDLMGNMTKQTSLTKPQNFEHVLDQIYQKD